VAIGSKRQQADGNTCPPQAITISDRRGLARIRGIDTNVLREPDFRAFYCRSGLSPAIELFTLAGGTPALHPEIQKQAAFVSGQHWGLASPSLNDLLQKPDSGSIHRLLAILQDQIRAKAHLKFI
jgi:hypothetical protein